MAITALVGFLALPVALAIWQAVSLSGNIRIAKDSGMPYIIRLTNHTNPFWMVFGNKIIAFLRLLPFGFLKSFIRFNLHGWEANERYNVHAEVGDIFMLVTPASRIVYVADSQAVADILRRKDDFRRDIKSMEVLNVYGKNLSTTDGAEWQKHRKITAVTFTERNRQMVWVESLKQAESMLQYWTERATTPIRTLPEDTNTFTLNVLAAALFSKTYSFRGKSEGKLEMKGSVISQDVDLASKYRDSLSTILNNIIAVMVFGGDVLSSWWMPRSMNEAGKAVHAFQSYAIGLIEEEKKRIRDGERHGSTPSLVNLLVQACKDEEATAEKDQGRASKTLTELEIVSDLFVFAFAGNDTTAITFAHTLVFLAAHPETQDWVHEELKHHIPGPDIADWSIDVYPHLKRCLAVVMESLRLCHPLSQLVKVTGPVARTLTVAHKDYLIPANTTVYANMSGLHTNTAYWGADALSWKPSRFIQVGNAAVDVFANESVLPDTSLEYLPWSTGQRVCPGKRFSQAELVAGLARLLYTHRIEAVPEGGESMGQAQERLHRTGMDIEMRLLMNMKDSSKAGVRWVRR